MEDERFTHILKDPKYRRIPKRERKIKIDKRFQSMFKDKKFKVKYTTDKRGRPVNHTSTEDLKRYYDLSSEEESTDINSENEEVKNEGSDNEVRHESNDLNEKDKSDKIISNKVKQKLRNLDIDYARGESTLYSESSSDEDDSEDEASESDEIDHKWGELDIDSEQTEEITHRLAACNMDWDRIRAIDLMVLFNSFLPPGGVIKSVSIYPSEFGKKRMAEEEVKGPSELVETKSENDNKESEEGLNYHMEKLRQYQLNRLKYYYAVIVFDSPNSANKIYMECDGMEYESSATKIDLRFISDDMVFDDQPKEVCDTLPEASKYQPRFFTTTALQQAKVNLTWDETNPERLEIAEKLRAGKIDGVSETDLQNYLASSSEEDEEIDEEGLEEEEVKNETGGSSIDKYKALLQEIEEKEKQKNNREVEMEISWGIDLKEKTDKLIKEKLTHKEKKTPFEQYLEKRKEKSKEKRKEKRKQSSKNEGDSDSDLPSDVDLNDKYFAEEFTDSNFRKPKKEVKKNTQHDGDENNDEKQAELELLLMDESDNREHFSLNKIQQRENESKSKKRARKKKNLEEDGTTNDDFQINVSDERFSALFTSHHFNIDPTDPHYKNTRAMEKLVNEKLKRRNNTNLECETKKIKVDKSRNAELNLLVKSVKRNVGTFKNKKF